MPNSAVKCEEQVKFGKIIGTVTATQKTGGTEGLGLFLVRELDVLLRETEKVVVAVDTVSAGYGDCVLTCISSSARCTARTVNVCTDATIVAIVDFVGVRPVPDIMKKSGG
jgi:ethanolamine utilization protein EutN